MQIGSKLLHSKQSGNMSSCLLYFLDNSNQESWSQWSVVKWSIHLSDYNSLSRFIAKMSKQSLLVFLVCLVGLNANEIRLSKKPCPAVTTKPDFQIERVSISDCFILAWFHYDWFISNSTLAGGMILRAYHSLPRTEMSVVVLSMVSSVIHVISSP